MRRLFIINWSFACLLYLLLFNWSCSNTKTDRIVLDNNNLDSLLVDAVNASHSEDFEVALSKLNFVINEAKSVNNYKNQIQGTINLGLLYFNYNAEEKALNYLLLSLDLTTKHKMDELLNSIYNNIGVVYSSNGEYKKAEKYFLKALKISQERQEPKRIGINLINLGELKSEEKEISQSRNYYKQALELFQELKDTNNIAITWNNIGNIFYYEKNYEIAQDYFKKAIELKNNQLNKFYLPSFNFDYGKTFYQFQEYDSAMVYFQSSLDGFLQIKNTEKIIESYNWLGKTYDARGVEKKAIEFYTESSSWKDSLLNEKSKRWVSEIQMKYEFGKKEKEIEYLHQKSRQQKLIWGGTILGLLLLSMLLYYSIKIKNTNLVQQNIILEKEQELSNLEISKNQLLQEKLKQKLEMKNRELASKAMHLLNKNEILTSISSILNKLNVQNEPQNANFVKNAKNTISRNINLDEQWDDFKIHFEEVHTGFFSRMLQEYPSLSQTDLRLSAYLVINLNNNEIAQISNISPDSVRKRKQRLREKLNLSKDQDILTFLTTPDLA